MLGWDTDAQGVFTIHQLIPVLAFQLSFQYGKQRFERQTKPADQAIEIKPGECRDLGTIKLQRVAKHQDE